MSSTAFHIATYIAAQGLGTLSTDIFVGGEPKLPDTCITAYDTGGTHANADAGLWDTTFQIRVRSHSYLEGYALTEQIRDLLLNPTSRIIEDWYYTGFWLISDIAKIGRDESDRELFTVNFRCMRQKVAEPKPLPLLLAGPGIALMAATDTFILWRPA